MNRAEAETNRNISQGQSPVQTPTLLMVIAGVAFLALFAGWIFLYNWLAALTKSDELTLGLLAAFFWLVVFGIVLVAAKWSNTLFTSWQTRDLLFVAVVSAVFGPLFVVWTSVYKLFGAIPGLASWNDLESLG